jgi:hypothetical protein
MDKTDLLNNLFYGHIETLGRNFEKEFTERAIKYRDKHLSDPDPEFVKGLYDEMPELKILDIQFMKKKLISIDKSLTTIRTIIVITFICAIIGVLISLFSSMKITP